MSVTTKTADERRLVAGRLRGLEAAVSDVGELYDRGEVEMALGLESDDGAWYMAGPVRWLADLIDPTCTNVGGSDWPFECSRCGYRTTEMDHIAPGAEEARAAKAALCEALGADPKDTIMSTPHSSVPLYCPRCGARVV